MPETLNGPWGDSDRRTVASLAEREYRWRQDDLARERKRERVYQLQNVVNLVGVGVVIGIISAVVRVIAEVVIKVGIE